MKTEEHIREFEKYVIANYTRNPVVVVKGEGSCVWDADGKKYLDFSAQLVCCNLGHKNKRIQEALRAQGEKLFYVAPGFATEPATRLAESSVETPV